MEIREIVKLIGRFNRTHRSFIQQIMESEGLFYGQLPILEVVKNYGACTQKQIALILRVTPPSVTTSVKRLERKGYLKKSIDEKDQRNTLISITEEGKKKTASCREKFDCLDGKVFSVLSDEECETLANLLLKLNESIEKEELND
ncbi:MAG: MarR family winged helix-turn-helix transcriptional regulator [Traorella sp.]